MNKILEAIKALGENATHPKFITEALKEIHDEFEALKQRVEKLEPKAEPEAPAAVVLDSGVGVVINPAPVVPPVIA